MVSIVRCEIIDGYVENADDCDDSNPFIFVGAAEIEDESQCMKDEDNDGYGDLFLNEEGVSEPPEIVAGTDCDDGILQVSRCRTNRICDGLDNNWMDWLTMMQ